MNFIKIKLIKMRMHVKNINTFCVSISLEIVHDLFWIMGFNLNDLTWDNVCIGESVRSISFVVFYTYFYSECDSYKGVRRLQR